MRVLLLVVPVLLGWAGSAQAQSPCAGLTALAPPSPPARPGTPSPRANCYANLAISIDRPRRDVWLPAPGEAGRTTRLIVRGRNVGYTDIAFTAGPAPAQFTFQRGPSDVNCGPPNCVRLAITTRPGTSRTVVHTLRLGWPPPGSRSAVLELVAREPQARQPASSPNRPLIWCEWNRPTCP